MLLQLGPGIGTIFGTRMMNGKTTDAVRDGSYLPTQPNEPCLSESETIKQVKPPSRTPHTDNPRQKTLTYFHYPERRPSASSMASTMTRGLDLRGPRLG